MTELLLGCGSNRTKKIHYDGKAEWTDLITLDMNADHKPDIVGDLANMPLPFPMEFFDEIHAYDVLEHVGAQGDWRFFFRQWEEFHRLLKPGGVFCGMSPAPHSPWAWGDPGHTRVIGQECLVYLDRTQYAKQVGITAMTDYRAWYGGDFKILHSDITSELQHVYVLQAIKPARD